MLNGNGILNEERFYCVYRDTSMEVEDGEIPSGMESSTTDKVRNTISRDGTIQKRS